MRESIVNLGNWTSGNSLVPVSAIDPGGVIHVVRSDSTPGNEEI
jgi:hypothetical protein